MAVGILIGLLAALVQSLCYVVSGSYVRRTGKPGWTLVAPQRMVMALPYAALAWLCRPASFGSEGASVVIGAGVVLVALLAGDAGLFQTQKYVEPSRVSTLQTAKIPVILLMSAVLFGTTFNALQLASVGLALASALLLLGAGRRISAAAWAWLGLCAVGYAHSDLFIGYTLDHTRGICGGVLRSALFTLGVTHFVSAVAAIPAYVAQKAAGRPAPTGDEWLKYAVGYGVLWMVAMVFLLVCFSTCGVVCGTIAQSTRGLISVVLGWLLARHGFADVEAVVPRRVFARRIVAAVLSVGAMVLYAVAKG